MSLLSAYLPNDRRLALVGGGPLPDRTRGAALFADISGFTPLTAALAAELGRQRGAEEVLNHINPIYEALIGELWRYRGSVIGFAGDSITCWLDGDDGRRAVACALNMQEIMAHFATVTTRAGIQVTLSVKIAVSAGPARRFLVGDPQIHHFEALAGATLERMAAAEGQAERGDVVVSREVVDHLGHDLVVSDWRQGNRFAVVIDLEHPPEAEPWPDLIAGHPDAFTAEQLRPWIDAPVFERLLSGASYLAELRPAASLFLRFRGIDYDGDDGAGEKLDAFVRWVQLILARYEGYLLQLTIGDKGSNLLAVFGAPVAHDDDDARAVAAALDLQDVPPELAFIAPPQIGVSQGLTWAGACGGRRRCIYTVMGDEVNMAARLMGKAEPGQVLVNQHVAGATARRYRYHALGEIAVKGRTAPLPVSEVVGRRTGAEGHLAALYASPLVGREEILVEMQGHLAAAHSGQGQIVRLEGVAGVGKSHLAAAFAAQAAEQGWQAALGACQSITQGTAYAPWRQLLFVLLELPADAPVSDQVDYLTATLERINPEWTPRLPLLGDLLGLPLADNPATAALEPRLRQQALLALVVEIVQTWAQRRPLLLVLEDVHWLDEASAELTVAVARAIGRVPALLLAVQRPPLQADQPILPALDHLATYHPIYLADLSPEGVAALVGNRLQGSTSPLVQALIWAQAQGNPFFTEELVDALREAGYLERQLESGDVEAGWVLSAAAFDALLDANCLIKVEGEWQMVDNPPFSAAKLDIPNSVQGTVLARLDRLPEVQKLTLKVASVIGRTFSLGLLAGVHPARPDAVLLQRQVEEMGARDFVRLETEAPEIVYIFKHNTTQEVAYGTLLFAQRQELHTAVAGWHERAYGGDAPLDELTLDSPLAPHYSLLVHHWHNAENDERERAYAGLAGEQAAKQYANESAVRYFSRALDLTPEADLESRYRLLLGREGANDMLGKRDVQARDLGLLSELARILHDPQKNAQVSLRQATYAGLIDDYPSALEAVQQAVTQALAVQDHEIEAKSYHEWGRILTRQANYGTARQKLESALHHSRMLQNRREEARCLFEIGNIDYYQADYVSALACYQQARNIYQAIGYRIGEAQCLLMFGAIQYQLGDYMSTQASYLQALAISRAIGWRIGEVYALASLGNNTFDLGDYQATKTNQQQALVLSQEIGYRYQEAASLDTLSLVYLMLGDTKKAREKGQCALTIQQEIGDRRSQGYTLNHLGLVFVALGDLDAAENVLNQALSVRRELGQAMLTMDDLAGLAQVALARKDLDRAALHAEEILTWLADNSPDGIEFPILVYLTCYRVLLAAAGDDPTAIARAKGVLAAGYKLLQERVNLIKDDALRQQFLENVPFNRDLLAVWNRV